MRNEKMSILIEEYRTVREEIIFRMKERNKIFNYLLLIISSLIVGVWQFREDSGRKEYLIILIFLLIVPLT